MLVRIPAHAFQLGGFLRLLPGEHGAHHLHHLLHGGVLLCLLLAHYALYIVFVL